MSSDISTREIEAFRQFLLKLPHGKDIVLVILKGQLLIEEQVKQIVRERVRNVAALDDARFSFNQYVSLAHALTGNAAQQWVWSSLKKLGALRNKIAHEMEPQSLTKEIDKFIDSIPGVFTEIETQDHLELKFWSLFVNVAALVERSSAKLLTLDGQVKNDLTPHSSGTPNGAP